eukprot:tig00021127_g18704.t1
MGPRRSRFWMSVPVGSVDKAAAKPAEAPLARYLEDDSPAAKSGEPQQLTFSHANLGVYRDQPFGEGSFGSVYPARIERGIGAGRRVIVKESNTDEFAIYFGQVERYMNEKLWPECKDHIAAFMGSYALPSGALGLVWDTEGTQTLSDVLNKQNWLDELEAAFYGRSFGFDAPLERHRRVVRDIARQLLEALAALHERSIVHRDIKPENILLVGGGRLKLIDLGCSVETSTGFGFAKNWGAGDLRYLPPERLVNRYVFPDRFDLYSAAIVLLQVTLPALRDDVALAAATERLRRANFNLEEWIKGQGNVRPGADQYELDGLALLFDDERALFNLVKPMLARLPLQRPSARACLTDTRFLAGPEAEAAASSKSPLASLGKLFSR